MATKINAHKTFFVIFRGVCITCWHARGKYKNYDPWEDRAATRRRLSCLKYEVCEKYNIPGQHHSKTVSSYTVFEYPIARSKVLSSLGRQSLVCGNRGHDIDSTKKEWLSNEAVPTAGVS